MSKCWKRCLMQRTSGSCFPNIFRPLTFKTVTTPLYFLCRASQRQSRVAVCNHCFASGWRFIIIPFSARSTCHREKLHKHRQHDGRIQDKNEITNYTKQFRHGWNSFNCKYEIQCRFFHPYVLVCFQKMIFTKN